MGRPEPPPQLGVWLGHAPSDEPCGFEQLRCAEDTRVLKL